MKKKPPLSLAPSKGHDGYARILLEPGSLIPTREIAVAWHPFRPLPPAGDENRLAAVMELRDHDLNTIIANPNGRPPTKRPIPIITNRQRKVSSTRAKEKLNHQSQQVS